MTNGRERWGCVFLLFLLVFSLPAAALSRGMANNGIQDGLDDSDNENAFLPPHPPNPVLGIVPPAESVPLRIQLQTSPSGAPACRLSQLTPSEVQAFKDTILTSGFQGEEISAGTPPNLNRETVADENTLIVPDPARNGTAIQKEVPTQFLEPEELSPLLNKHIKNGTFAFGLSMTDSLRTARCLTPEQCAVSGEMLRLRNSGEGFTGNIQNMWSSIKGDLGKPDSLFSEEEADYLLGGVEAEQELGEADANYIPVEGFSRIPSNELMNWIAVDNTFSSALLTNCTDSSCITMLYSMFDKYFNAWFSGEMVIGTFGPTAWGKLRYMITRGKRINLISANWADPLRRNIDLENRWKFRNIEGIGLGGNKPIAPSEFFSKRRPGGTIEGKEVFKN
ncbi:MAG: hypothetical protein U1C71_00045, partial [archaeon]|nr:hypothetical protein [archaeon]